MGNKQDTRITKIETMFATLFETLKKMDERLEGMDHVIRGNGAPGLVSDVRDITTRVTSMEGSRNRWRDLCFTMVGGIVVGVAVYLFSTSWSKSHDTKNLPQMQQISRDH